MDFCRISSEYTKNGEIIVLPEFFTIESKDIMIHSGKFIAIWDEERQTWSKNEHDAIRLIDKELDKYCVWLRSQGTIDPQTPIIPRYVKLSSSKSSNDYYNYIKKCPDTYRQLDENLRWLNSPCKREDYSSKCLPYELKPGDFSCYDRLMSRLYAPNERRKIEWAIGAIVANKAKTIQKFIVLYGPQGAGKGTVLKIIDKLFEGYCTPFKSSALGEAGNSFATEPFKDNPLVAIESDGKLDRIEDNTVLNSIISHEKIPLNAKYAPIVPAEINAFLFIGSNSPVKITDGKSGLIRRLIDVSPTGDLFDSDEYDQLMQGIDNELGPIAWHCREVFNDMGKDYYKHYEPIEMRYKTDPFFNFVEENMLAFEAEDYITNQFAYSLYKPFCEKNGLKPKTEFAFKEELKNYFEDFKRYTRIDGKQVRSVFFGFKKHMFEDRFDKGDDTKQKVTVTVPETVEPENDIPDWLKLKKMTHSRLDDEWADCPAQYVREDNKAETAWIYCKTTLKDIDPTRVHYVMPPSPAHIFLDFDIKDENGNKCRKLCLEAASKFRKTYTENSKGGEGLHLHYIYKGDPNELAAEFGPGIEIKVCQEGKKLPVRRRLIEANDEPMAELEDGYLPKQEAKELKNFDGFANDRMLLSVIRKHINKEIAGSTHQSMNMIKDCLDKAYAQGLKYDLSALRPTLLSMATSATNSSLDCIRILNQMKLKSDDSDEVESTSGDYDDDRIVFFDIEVFKNLLLVVYKFIGEPNCFRMINPTPGEVRKLLQYKLIGYNNRKYDNHILHARALGWDLQRIYELSKDLIAGNPDARFMNAYNESYSDVYDFLAAKDKMSLKKWEIKLHMTHMECRIPWDEPAPPERWDEIAEYCENDVRSTEAVFFSKEGQAAWRAREIMAELTDSTVNTKTNTLSERWMFGNDKNHKDEFVYTDLAKLFPGYEYDEHGIDKSRYLPGSKPVSCRSIYRGEDPSEGGYVYAEEGIYNNVALLDIASMHPSTIRALNLFGPRYTQRFIDLLETRVFIKHGQFEEAKKKFNGALSKYLDDPKLAKDLANAIKTLLNSIYGLTTSSFDNAFRDPRNIDNIVAKRGSLFMIDLKHAVQDKGFTVVHIKTDSIKIADATPEIIQFVMDFGKKYQYNFEHEATYEKMCLVNDAVYIAKYDSEGIRNELDESKKHRGEWTATGAQFQQPYVFKRLFSREPIEFEDCCELKSVTSSAIYLDMNEDLPNVKAEEAKVKKLQTMLKKVEPGHDAWNDIQKQIQDLKAIIAKGHDYHFIGKNGQFTPVCNGNGGGELVRYNNKTGNYDSVTGTSDFRWLESEMLVGLGKTDIVNYEYYDKYVDAAIAAIKKVAKPGQFEEFLPDSKPNPLPPWKLPCGSNKYETCFDCPEFNNEKGTCGKNYDITCAIRKGEK